MALGLARIEGLTYAYPGAPPALRDLSLELHAGELVALLGPSGGGKSTLLRSLSGLVPHFHGGRFAGRVEVAGLDTRVVRPADLAGIVAGVFQDPEEQVVMTRVANEVAFGLENLGTPPGRIWGDVHAALDLVGAAHLAQRPTTELSGGELQLVCLAAALALEPELLLLDEPTSQLDASGAEVFLAHVAELGVAVLISEQRVGRALGLADRALFVDGGRLLVDAPLDEAVEWLGEHRPLYVPGSDEQELDEPSLGEPVLRLEDVSFAYRPGEPVLEHASLELRRGEVVALEGPNGSGKTTLAKIATGLLRAGSGIVERDGRAGYLSQDPGRYVVRERSLDEVGLAVGGDRARASAALARVGLRWAAERHPRDLSSGERERLGLAAVAVAEPDLLVLDEPTRGIDPERKAELAGWLVEYAAEGRAVLVVTHDRSFPAHRRVRIGAEERIPLAV